MRVRALAAAAVAGLIIPTVIASSAQAADGDYIVTAVHAIASAPTVDVFVGDAVPEQFDDLEYGDTDFIPVPPGTVAAVAVTAADATTPTPLAPSLAGTFTVNSDVSLVAQVDADNAVLLKPYVDNYSPVPAGQARIIVRHAAAAPTVSVDANGAQLIAAISNGESQEFVVPAGGYTVDVKVGGAIVPGLTTEGVALPIDAGNVYIVYATGDKDTGYDFVIDGGQIEQLPAATPTTTPATTRPAVPTAVPAGDGSAGWGGPLGIPALLAIVLAAGLAVTVGFSMRGSASRR